MGRAGDVENARAAAIEGLTAAGAFVMGRTMLSMGRGAWDEEWAGPRS